MFNEMEFGIEDIFSGELLKHYNFVNNVINEIFATITTADNIDKIIEKFERTTAHYGLELKKHGYIRETTLYLTVCAEFSHLLDKADKLVLHEKYFRELFNRLDYLIYIKAIKHEFYEQEYDDFFDYYINQVSYFSTEVYVPKHEYDEEALSKIITPFVGGCK